MSITNFHIDFCHKKKALTIKQQMQSAAKTKTTSTVTEKRARSFNLYAENQFLSILQLSHCFCQFYGPLREG